MGEPTKNLMYCGNADEVLIIGEITDIFINMYYHESQLSTALPS